MKNRRMTGYEVAARAQRSLDEEYYPVHYTRASNAPAWTMAVAMIAAVIAFGVWLAPDLLSTTAALAPAGAVGNQAPPSAVNRSGTPVRSVTYATPIPGLAQNQATADAEYNALAGGDPSAQATPTLPALPLNSAGKPVITAEQLRQQQLALQLAEQERNAAAAMRATEAAIYDAQVYQQQLNAQATADAAALARPPDVSKQDAEQMMHRDLCHVPRANPATCAKGLYKPTPVQ